MSLFNNCICAEMMDRMVAKWDCPVHGEREPRYDLYLQKGGEIYDCSAEKGGEGES